MSPSKCKEFDVTITFAEPKNDDNKNPLILTLSIPNNAKISDLIGLCCFTLTKLDRNLTR